MSCFISDVALEGSIGDYRTGKANASLSDPGLLQLVRMRRRQLGRMMQALDVETAKKRIPEAPYFISKKVDGEFSCLLYRDGDIISLNPGGTIRTGAPLHKEAVTVLENAGIKEAIFAGELYVKRSDGERARVHDVARVARSPSSEEDLESLCFAIFNVYSIDGTDLSMNYAEAMKTSKELFSGGNYIHPVEWVVGDRSAVFDQFNQWVLKEGAEGIVIRSDAAGVFKIKQRHTLDLAVIGFSEGIDDRAGMLHSLLLAIVRVDGDFQIIARVGGGFSDEQRVELLKLLEPAVVSSDYSEINSDRIAYRMLRPQTVVEISCLDIVSRTSYGNTIDKMILEWNPDKEVWAGVRRMPLCSIISPQFLRIRDDKQPLHEEVSITQVSNIAEIPEHNAAASEVELPKSVVLKRSAATKVLKGATMVRKLVAWQTNKQDHSRDYPAYVLHLTDFSPNRKAPLNHEICVTDSREQIDELFESWEKQWYVRGWKKT